MEEDKLVGKNEISWVLGATSGPTLPEWILSPPKLSPLDYGDNSEASSLPVSKAGIRKYPGPCPGTARGGSQRAMHEPWGHRDGAFLDLLQPAPSLDPNGFSPAESVESPPEQASTQSLHLEAYLPNSNARAQFGSHGGLRKTPKSYQLANADWVPYENSDFWPALRNPNVSQHWTPVPTDNQQSTHAFSRQSQAYPWMGTLLPLQH